MTIFRACIVHRYSGRRECTSGLDSVKEASKSKRTRYKLAAMDHAADALRTDLMTITRHVLNEQSKFPEARGDLTILLNNIVLGCKFVCSSVSKVLSPSS